ncbi:MAG: hypothetical protein IPM52_11260 [Bacteroidetes bacterium]|nr:hypothetical protein [Bacteroidota bacterium]
MNAGRIFHGKLLLFGEYTVVLGDQALVVPSTEVSGRWSFAHLMADKALAAHSNQALRSYVNWLRQQAEARIIDLDRFASDIEAGLAFDSDIPNGYGVGSSGALVAALFDGYRCVEVPENLSELRVMLGKLENYFHGNSSGLDPLACYVGKPLKINDREIEIIPHCPVPPQLRLHLHDTGITSPTGPLVEYFREQMKTYSFYKKIDRQLIPANHKAIAAWINGDTDTVWMALREISAFQLRHFRPMIPENIRQMWQDSLAGERQCLKLCGSGGGGYVMVFERR